MIKQHRHLNFFKLFPLQQEPEADQKKTDAVLEDDPHQSDEEEEEKEKEKVENKPSKADLEGPEKEVEVSFD